MGFTTGVGVITTGVGTTRLTTSFLQEKDISRTSIMKIVDFIVEICILDINYIQLSFMYWMIV